MAGARLAPDPQVAIVADRLLSARVDRHDTPAVVAVRDRAGRIPRRARGGDPRPLVDLDLVGHVRAPRVRDLAPVEARPRVALPALLVVSVRGAWGRVVEREHHRASLREPDRRVAVRVARRVEAGGGRAGDARLGVAPRGSEGPPHQAEAPGPADPPRPPAPCRGRGSGAPPGPPP